LFGSRIIRVSITEAFVSMILAELTEREQPLIGYFTLRQFEVMKVGQQILAL